MTVGIAIVFQFQTNVECSTGIVADITLEAVVSRQVASLSEVLCTGGCARKGLEEAQVAGGEGAQVCAVGSVAAVNDARFQRDSVHVKRAERTAPIVFQPVTLTVKQRDNRQVRTVTLHR